MTRKELRRMSRVELIEIIAALKKRETELQEQLDWATQQLEDRTVRISNAGSIAEAALALNGIFEAAQAAADTYLNSVISICEGKEDDCEAEEKSDDGMLFL